MKAGIRSSFENIKTHQSNLRQIFLVSGGSMFLWSSRYRLRQYRTGKKDLPLPRIKSEIVWVTYTVNDMPLNFQSHMYIYIWKLLGRTRSQNLELYLSLQIYTRGDIAHLWRIRSIFVPELLCRLHADAWIWNKNVPAVLSLVRRFWIRNLNWILYTWINILRFTDMC